jgi:hypothetical protein
MLTAMDDSKFLFEWDLQNIDISQDDISSTELFSFQGSKYYISLFKKEGTAKYGCYICPVETSSTRGRIHFRFDLLKKMDNIVAKSHLFQRELKELNRGRGVADWIESSTIRDHILKVKMCTSEYDFEYDLEHIYNTTPSGSFDHFFIGENKLRVNIALVKNEGGTNYNLLLRSGYYNNSRAEFIQVDLFKSISSNPTSVNSLSTL